LPNEFGWSAAEFSIPCSYDAAALSTNLSIINLLHIKEKNSCIYSSNVFI